MYGQIGNVLNIKIIINLDILKATTIDAETIFDCQ
jgi:hypothetical protein